MPKLKSFDTESFEFPINKNKKILFANNKGQKTYIKNRMDRMLSKEPETINWINSFNHDSIFFDIGANLTSSHFSKDLDVVLNDSLTAGVEKICITSSNLDDVKNAKKISEKYKNLYYSVGFHPHNAKDFKIEFLKSVI